MTNGQLSGVLRHLRTATLVRDDVKMTDAHLLECFITRRDEAAFAALVRRHGPMVLRVCHRQLRNPHDAEDAFQATFLVLALKADSLRHRDLVGNWLYGAAYRAALEVKAARRKVKERQVRVMPEPVVADGVEVWRDLRPILDDELNRLADKYRLPVVLCDLEGRTRKDVARHLGIPEGTLSGRLTIARRLLAKRLARRGLALSAGAFATVLAPDAATGCLPAPVVISTIKSAMLLAAERSLATVASASVAAIAKGVLRAMLMSKLKAVAAFLIVVGLAAAGGGTFAGHYLAAATLDLSEADTTEPENHATGRDAEVQKIRDKFLSVRPDDKELAVFQLDWEPSLRDAKARAAKEKRPIFLVVVTNSFGNMYSGHC